MLRPVRPPSSAACRPPADRPRSPLPYSKYCLQHVLKDPAQVLYKQCQGDGGAVECGNAVLSSQVPQLCDVCAAVRKYHRNPRLAPAPAGSGAQSSRSTFKPVRNGDWDVDIGSLEGLERFTLTATGLVQRPEDDKAYLDIASKLRAVSPNAADGGAGAAEEPETK